MPDDQQGLKRLMARVRDGDQDAVRELLDTYGDFLLHVIRRRLNRPLRTQFDSADFVQAVWASFFTGRLKDQEFASPEDLINFLAGLARNKVCDAARKGMRTDKRNLYRAHSLDGSAAALAGREPSPLPTPSQVVMAEEQWNRLLDGQPEHYRRILLLLREGHTQQEVAAALRLNEKTVRRVVGLAALRLKRGANG
jgi:RNA polymerase sigma factor (sigma-70 family)